VGLPRRTDRLPQCGERRQHLLVRVVRISSARVRQHEYARVVHGCVLKSRLDGGGALGAKHLQQRAINRHADERHDFRPEAIDLLLENVPALDVLRRPERVDSRTRPRHQVRDAQAPFGQPHIVEMGDPLGHQAGVEQQSPEPIGRAREVMAGLRRLHARVDADEQHPHPWGNSISQTKVFPSGLRMAHDLWLMAHGGLWLMLAHGSRLEP
jgi:hypothetical protein